METLETSIENRIGYITLNRPEKRNALNNTMVSELSDAVQAMEEDENVKVTLLKANGKVFSAGADLQALHELQENSQEENRKDSQGLLDLFQTIYNSQKPIIAQAQGHAIAGGCGLISCCDFVFSTPEAKMGFTEVRIGFVPAIVMTFIRQKIGDSRSKELLLSGDLYPAETMEKFGLVNRIIDANELEAQTREFAEHLCDSNSTQAMKLTKRLFADLTSMDFREGLQWSAEINAKARETDDCKKGVAAFLNKEQLKW